MNNQEEYNMDNFCLMSELDFIALESSVLNFECDPAVEAFLSDPPPR